MINPNSTPNFLDLLVIDSGHRVPNCASSPRLISFIPRKESSLGVQAPHERHSEIYCIISMYRASREWSDERSANKPGRLSNGFSSDVLPSNEVSHIHKGNHRMYRQKLGCSLLMCFFWHSLVPAVGHGLVALCPRF